MFSVHRAVLSSPASLIGQVRQRAASVVSDLALCAASVLRSVQPRTSQLRSVQPCAPGVLYIGR